MPVSTASVSVGTAVTVLAGPSIQAKLVYVQDGDYENQTAVYVGGENVTAATGVKLSKVNVSVFQLDSDDTLFAIGDAATSSVRVTQVS